MAASASEVELSPGEAFELTATVGNVGDRRASATTLRYRRSADAAITTGDTEVGTEPVAALAAAQSIARSLSLSAPTAPGTYHYGACADAVAEETNTANNCSAAVAVRVTEPVARPDLTVKSPSVSDARPDTGASFTFSATVRNAGDSSSAATTLRYRRSAAATITTADAQVGTDAVDELVASGMSAESIALTAPSTSGTYYYGACVDAVSNESNVKNNCSLARAVTVREPQMPDLAVSDFASGIERRCGSTVRRMRTTVSNAGPGAAPLTTLRYYWSTDAASSSDDEEIGAAEVPALEPSATWHHALEIPPASETRYYYACVDAVTGETSADDNCSSPAEASGFVPSGPDLIVGRPSITDLYWPDLWVGARFTNVGDRPSGDYLTVYYGSIDDTISTDDMELMTADLTSPLDPGCGYYISTRVPAPPTGYDYVGVCVVPVPGESNTDNNCSGARHLDEAN